MKRLIVFLLTMVISYGAFADTNVPSQISHIAGGAFMAGAITAISDKYFPEYDRAWVGFTVSAVAGVLSQYYEYSNDTNTASDALADAASHALGAAIGSIVTDRYILMPVASKNASGDIYLGVNLMAKF